MMSSAIALTRDPAARDQIALDLILPVHDVEPMASESASDPLGAARGILFAVQLSIVFWALVSLAVYKLWF